MELLMTPTSPFVRKVRVFARERGLVLTETPVSPLEDDSRLLEAHPLGRVPCLLDGLRSIVDSRVIVQHLGQGEDGRRTLEDRVLEAEADGIMDAGVAIVMERRRPVQTRSEDWIERQTLKIVRSLQTRPIFSVETPISVGALAFGCALGYIDFRLPEVLWREQRGELADLFSRLAQRPSFVETMPPADR
ncbi:MAG: glutathione S-transferase N-terminal domain-containing protein [Myxococcota bacterium]